MELNIGICDDKEVFLNTEAQLIQKVCDEKKIQCSIYKFQNSRALQKSAVTFDILFLDIQMPGENGINVARKYLKRYRDCVLFFITSYRDDYLDDAFVEAFRCFSKPLDPRRLSAGMDSAVRRISQRRDFVELVFDGNKQYLKKHNIIYFYTESKRTNVVTTSGKYQMRESLKCIKETNDLSGFVETHKSFLVNEEYVVNWTGETTNKVYLRYKDKEYTADLSKRRFPEVKKYFLDLLKE